MNDTIENPKISISELNKMEFLVKENKAEVSDYQRLDSYLNFLGFQDYLLNKFHANRINDFEDFIFQRNQKQYNELNILVGFVLGVISFLKGYVNGKI